MILVSAPVHSGLIGFLNMLELDGSDGVWGLRIIGNRA